MKIFTRNKFDADWYLKQNPDVAKSGSDPYEHYKRFGKREGRLPSPQALLNKRDQVKLALRPIKLQLVKFAKYLHFKLPLSQNRKSQIKDFCYQHFAVLFRGEPSYQFWLRSHSATGLKQAGNNLNGTAADWHLMLPAKPENIKQTVVASSIVDIIIPVYRGLEQTQRCINSVLTSSSNTTYRLIVINDASPEVEMTQYLRSLSSTPKVIVVENVENLGFTATVNRGMSWSDENDVLLLNSDTEVANDWLDRIKAHAYTGSRIGSVTPFSNNATICNYPTLDGLKELPASEKVGRLDMAFASANKGRNIEIPTAVGFCMYIRRDCLADVGLFDVETFGKGYGEENDFCLRATAKGWKHLLAADTFVFHEGEVSFQAGSNPRKERAMTILRQRYPEYEADVARHVLKNEAYPFRVAATAARYKQAGLPVVLHVLHTHGGGTQKHVDELCKLHYGKAKLLIMTPGYSSEVATLRLRSVDNLDALDVHLPTTDITFLVSLFKSFGVSLVHIHHVLGYSFDLQSLIKKSGIPFYLTVHDYMLICPRINLMPMGSDYCGEPEAKECNRCLSVNYPLGSRDIIWWRESHAWLFNEASVVICPSQDVAQRCGRYFPNAKYQVVSHEIFSKDFTKIKAPTLDATEPLRIAILGVLAKHKGHGLISEALSIAKKTNTPLEFRLIGYAQEAMPSVPKSLFTQTGAYEDASLQNLIEEFNPHLILFPARWPETYSYTLSAAIESNRPIMVPNLGAFPERVISHPWTWINDWSITPAQLVNKLCEIRLENFSTSTMPTLSVNENANTWRTHEDIAFYVNNYLAANNNVIAKSISDIRKPGKVTALVLVENVGTQPSPCAYIRLLLPLLRERSKDFEYYLVTVDQVSLYAADVLITQRTAVTSISAINSIVDHCIENTMRIVYDLDDLLLALPEDHPEHTVYAPKSAAVLHWLTVADEVWLSTEALQSKVSHINSHTHVIHNYIDDKLWVTPSRSTAAPGKKEVVRLLYMGTQTHVADFELVENVLNKLKREFSSRIEINLIGISPDAENTSWYKTIKPPVEIGASYPAFVNWMCNEPTFDIGIAPLTDNEFNRCKSEIKFLDYCALGLVTVASDINGYALIRNGENGFRVKNTEEAWYEILKKLIVDSNLRSKIQHVAQNELTELYGYKSIYGCRTERLASLINNKS